MITEEMRRSFVENRKRNLYGAQERFYLNYHAAIGSLKAQGFTEDEAKEITDIAVEENHKRIKAERDWEIECVDKTLKFFAGGR